MLQKPLLPQNLVSSTPLGRRPTVIEPDSMRAAVRVTTRGSGTPAIVSICLLVQSIMGGGLLAFPHTFLIGGVYNMLVLQGSFLIVIAAGLWVLAWCTERTGASTYQAVVKCLLGRRAEVFCAVSLIVLIFGAAVVYLDVCVDQVFPWIQEAAQNCSSELLPVPQTRSCLVLTHLNNRSVVTITVGLTVSLLCLGRNLASLSLPSLLGFAALVYVCFVVIANYAVGVSHGAFDISGSSPGTAAAGMEVVKQEVAWWRSGLQQWLSMVPVICFAYQGHISAVPIYAELKYRSMSRWIVVIGVGLAACVLLYNVSGFLGYVQFLDSTRSDVLQSFLEHQLFIPQACVSVARVAVAVAVSVTFAVFTFCARGAVLDELAGLQGKPVGPLAEPASAALRIGVTYVWVILVSIVAILAPNIGAVVSIVGNVSSFFMFQFPGLFLIATAYMDSGCAELPGLREQLALFPQMAPKQKTSVVVGWSFFLLGMFVFVFGMANALYTAFA